MSTSGTAFRLQGFRHVVADELEVEPQAYAVPSSHAAAQALKASIQAHGVLVPLLVRGHRVVDGAQRLAAAKAVGLREVPVLELSDVFDTTDIIEGTAVARRHLTKDQLAVFAARWMSTRQRQKGGDRRSVAARINRDPVVPVDSHPARSEAARLFGVSVAKVKKATQLLLATEEEADRVLRGAVGLGAALAEVQKRAQLTRVEALPPPQGVFRTVVVDPPWKYRDEGCIGAAAKHYPCMELSELEKLPVPSLLAQEAHLYLCTTGPMVPSAMQLLEAWGVRYNTLLVWKKPKLGLGRHFRSQAEYIVFGVKGRLPTKANNLSNFFEAPQGRHSEKPDLLFERVEEASPGPYLELFARRSRPGWTCWGAEVPAPAIHETCSLIKPLGATP
jgi:N6-adenosine-specific RNA methylase IME4